MEVGGMVQVQEIIEMIPFSKRGISSPTLSGKSEPLRNTKQHPALFFEKCWIYPPGKRSHTSPKEERNIIDSKVTAGKGCI